MGTILTSEGQAGYDHEGDAGQVLDDGTITATYHPATYHPASTPWMIGHLVRERGAHGRSRGARP